MSSPSLPIDRRQLLAAGAGVIALSTPALGLAAAAAVKPGRGQSFDLGWRFLRGAGEGLEAPGLDDAAWRKVDLPHDWSIEDLPNQSTGAKPTIVGPFDRKAEGGTATGFAVGGEGWYRKHFKLTPPAGGRVELLFEAAYMNSDVWLNGQHLGAHAEGYTPFAYDLTPHLSATGDNVLAVRVRNLGKNSRWYSGSGLYRHVWLDVLAQPARIARWGVGVSTRRLEAASAVLDIETRLEDLTPDLTVAWTLKDPAGKTVWKDQAPAQALVSRQATAPKPRAWSPDTPALYSLETQLRRGGEIIDRIETPFGIRVVAFDAAQGMTINGQPTKLRGGCIHHDNGPLGAAAYDAAEERKVLLLKARGYNAVRPSHNLFSPAFLRACDRHGMLVIEEMFDTWRWPKLPEDYAAHFDDEWRTDLETIVRATRNHPSIIMWSIGNEIPNRNSVAGLEVQWRLANAVHALDPIRPVTAAINSFPGHLVTPTPDSARAGSGAAPDHASAVYLDVVGYNYKLADYEADHRQFPERVFFGSESFSRDIFGIWDLTDRSPWLIGDFVWTAMDYLGEAAIGGSIPAASASALSLGAWPFVNAYCGDLDLIGQQKAPSLARDVVWGLSALEVAVQKPLPAGKVEAIRPWGWSDEWSSWTWPGAEGKPLAVRLYTSGDRVAVRLNGVVVATKAVTAADLKHVEVTVDYAPGVLDVVAYRGDAVVGRKRLETVGPPTALRLVPESARGGSARGDVSFVRVEVVDARGRVVPDASAPIELKIEGPAELAAFASANPVAHGGFQALTTTSWRGQALAVLRGAGRDGAVKLTATSQGLASATTALRLAKL